MGERSINDADFFALKFIFSIIFFTISAIICWRVDREECKSLEAYLAKVLVGVVVCSISMACVIGMDDAKGPMVILSIIFFHCCPINIHENSRAV